MIVVMDMATTVDIFSKLDSNKTLTPEDKLFLRDFLVKIDNHMKFISPLFSFAGLGEKLDTLEIDDRVDLSDREIVNYDVMRNAISIREKSFIPSLDLEYLVATKLLVINMSCTKEDEDVYRQNIGINNGFASLCIKARFGNESDIDPFIDEEIIFNLLSAIAGREILIDTCIKNNPAILINHLASLGYNRDSVIGLMSLINQNSEFLSNSNQVVKISQLNSIQIILIAMLNQKPNLTPEDMELFEQSMLKEEDYFEGVIYPDIEQSKDYFETVKAEFNKNYIR